VRNKILSAENLVTLFFILISVFFWRDVYQQTAAKGWARVDGRVTDVHVNRTSKPIKVGDYWSAYPYKYVRVNYEYTVGVSKYANDDYSKDETEFEVFIESKLQAFLDNHAVGGPISVYYNLSDPSDSVLHASGVSKKNLILAISSVLIALWSIWGRKY
jgi:hypothetical protein